MAYIVENAEICRNYIFQFVFLFDWFMEISFCESSNHISWPRQKNKASTSFFFLFFRNLVREMNFNLKSVIVINNHFNLPFIRKLIKLFYLLLLQKSSWSIRRVQKWSKILCQINQQIMKASKNNQSSWKALLLMCI